MTLSLVFMGSPEFAVPVLRKLAQHYAIAGVITQPDRPAGRGRTLTSPPVKIVAQELGLPTMQPRRLNEPTAMLQLNQWAPDIIIVAAFGQILRREVLSLPAYGCINVHASLLPRWRGAAPIQAAILNGDALTGITIMRMDPGVDTGPTLLQESVEISPEDTAGTLAKKLSNLGAELLLRTLPLYLADSLLPVPQDNSQATYASMIKKEDGSLDFNLPAINLERQVRAFNPWPGAFTQWKHQPLKVHSAHAIILPDGTPGKKIVYQSYPAFYTGDGILVLDELQPAGKKVLSGKDFLQGARDWEG